MFCDYTVNAKNNVKLAVFSLLNWHGLICALSLNESQKGITYMHYIFL